VVREETEVDLMKPITLSEEDIRMMHRAERWWKERGRKIPRRGTPAWHKMYDLWMEFAFEDKRVNPPAFKKPYRVETWFERDRKSIVVYDAADREIAEWWDEDVDNMVESGYFDASGFIMGREVHPRKLEDSVLGYVKEMGLDMPAGLDRAAKMRRVAAKRQGKNPPHWGYTMGELAAATRHLKSLQLHFTPEEIGRETKIAPQIQSSMLRGGSVYSGAPEALSKMYHEKVSQNNPGGDVHLDIDIGSHNAAKGARTSVNPPSLMVGDIVKYSRAFLQSTGMYTGSVPHATGKIINLSGTKDFILATIEWNDPDLPKRVNVKNLVLKSRLHLEPNPPLPASALMDISTAKTVVREVDSGARSPRPALSQADDLLDRGLQKLRGSHLGSVDWKNPPPIEIISSDPSKTDSSKMVLHYKLTSPMGSVKDVEKILMTLYPGWRAVAHASLREGTHPGVRHAYSVTLARSKGKPVFGNNPPATEVYRNVIEIRAEKKNGERFVHKFGRGSTIYGLPNGNILITSRSGKNLWKNFNMKG
jgi:hypothetical protein